jgi:hypothetical protein
MEIFVAGSCLRSVLHNATALTRASCLIWPDFFSPRDCSDLLPLPLPTSSLQPWRFCGGLLLKDDAGLFFRSLPCCLAPRVGALALLSLYLIDLVQLQVRQ